MTERKPIDWERIEAEYRAGQLSVREIARQHGVGAPAIVKRAQKLGWERDLSASVREAANAKLVKETAAGNTEGNTLNVRETVEAAAERAVAVVRQHRKDIATGRDIVASLMAELIGVNEAKDDIEAEIEEETKGDRNGQRRALMLKAVSLPSRAGVIKDLSAAMKNLLPLERQAFSLDAPEREKDDKPNDISDAERAARIAALLDRGRTRRDGPAANARPSGLDVAAGAADDGV